MFDKLGIIIAIVYAKSYLCLLFYAKYLLKILSVAIHHFILCHKSYCQREALWQKANNYPSSHS